MGQQDIEIVPIVTIKLLLCCTCELRYAILIWYFTLSTKSSFLPSEEPVKVDENLVHMINSKPLSILIFTILVSLLNLEILCAAEPVNSPVMWNEHRQNLRFQKLTANDGLSQSSVLTIVQDSKGFIWFGTEDGLSRYDGHIFKNFKHSPEDIHSLRSNRITTLFEDHQETLWIGTEDGGLHRYHSDNERFSNYPHDANISSTISDNRINVILETVDHDLWIGTQNGLNLVESESRKSGQLVFRRFLPNQGNPDTISGANVTAIHEDQNGTLWVGTRDGGLNKIIQNNATNDFRFIRYSLQENKREPAHVLSLSSDNSESIWVGTENGLHRFTPETQTSELFQSSTKDSNSLSHNMVREIYKDRSGTLWIGTDGGGAQSP